MHRVIETKSPNIKKLCLCFFFFFRKDLFISLNYTIYIEDQPILHRFAEDYKHI